MRRFAYLSLPEKHPAPSSFTDAYFAHELQLGHGSRTMPIGYQLQWLEDEGWSHLQSHSLTRRSQWWKPAASQNAPGCSGLPTVRAELPGQVLRERQAEARLLLTADIWKSRSHYVTSKKGFCLFSPMSSHKVPCRWKRRRSRLFPLMGGTRETRSVAMPFFGKRTSSTRGFVRRGAKLTQ